MEFILMIVCFAIFSILSDKMGGKKKIPPGSHPRMGKPFPVQVPPGGRQWPQQQQQSHPLPAGRKDLGFSIPELRNAPGTAEQAGGIYRENGALLQQQLEAQREALAEKERQQAYIKQRQAEEARIRAAEQADYESKAKLTGSPVEQPRMILPALTPSSARQAVVLAEILGKPKAYRRHR